MLLTRATLQPLRQLRDSCCCILSPPPPPSHLSSPAHHPPKPSSAGPNYDWTSQKTPNKAASQSLSFKFPLKPVVGTLANAAFIGRRDANNGTTNTAIVGGHVGIALNGVTLFTDADAQGRSVRPTLLTSRTLRIPAAAPPGRPLASLLLLAPLPGSAADTAPPPNTLLLPPKIN